MIDIEFLKYPIGRFSMPDSSDLEGAISQIGQLPNNLQEAVNQWTEEELDQPYRPGGWTVRQLIHHLSDSHMNAYVRFKWTLTEPTPTIKAYLEAAWATLPDSQLPISHSIGLLQHLHFKWCSLLNQMKAEDFQRRYIHPETGTSHSLLEATHRYAWHGQHHLAHIQHLALRTHR